MKLKKTTKKKRPVPLASLLPVLFLICSKKRIQTTANSKVAFYLRV